MKLGRQREQRNQESQRDQGPCGKVSSHLIGPEGITLLCLSQSPEGEGQGADWLEPGHVICPQMGSFPTTWSET